MDTNQNTKGPGGCGNVEDSGSHMTRQSSIVTVFAVWNTMMGTSLLAMPWGMERSGLLLGPVLMLALGAFCLYTAYLNLKADRQFGSPTGEISELSRALLGPYAELLSKLFSFIVLLGANIVYWILMCNFLYFSVDYIFGAEEVEVATRSITGNFSSGGVLCPLEVALGNGTTRGESLFTYVWDLNNTVPFFLALIIVPLLNFKSPTFFTKFNSLGTLSVVFLIMFVIVKACIWGVNLEVSDPFSLHYSPLFANSFPATSGMLALSYFIHNIIITIMRSNKNQKNNGRDLTIAYILVIGTYTSIGVVFYISFPLDKSFHRIALQNYQHSFSFHSHQIFSGSVRTILLGRAKTPTLLAVCIGSVAFLKTLRIFSHYYNMKSHVFIIFSFRTHPNILN